MPNRLATPFRRLSRPPNGDAPNRNASNDGAPNGGAANGGAANGGSPIGGAASGGASNDGAASGGRAGAEHAARLVVHGRSAITAAIRPVALPTALAATLALAIAATLTPAPADAAQRKARHAKPRIVVAAPSSKPPIADQAAGAAGYAERADVLQFAAGVAERSGIDPLWLLAALASARYQPAVARFIMPPPAGAAKNWAAYRDRFVEPVRIRAGAAFWQANQPWLALAEQRYGVPPAIVVGIVGVETIYGRQMGGFRIIDALATLGFDFPAGRKDRGAFFRDELEQYLLLCRHADADPLAARGSYAGAMGMPQFMPSSVNRWAVDFDGDGRIDLQASAADTIGSVAHYLAEFGWQRGLPTHVAVAPPVDAADRAWLLGPDIVPSFSARTFADRGARLDGVPDGFDGLLALVELQNGDAAPSYVAGTANFYAITRYNWSSYYAMAVIALGDAVLRRVNANAVGAAGPVADGRTLR